MLVAVLAFSAAASANEPNPEQTGQNGTCLDFNALFLVPGLQVESLLVEGATGWTASQQGGAAVYIDFYDGAGNHLGDSATHPHRTPAGATQGTICVGQVGDGWPDLPANATWTYQDGF